MVRNKLYGHMVVYKNNEMGHVPLSEAVDGLKAVSKDHYMVKL